MWLCESFVSPHKVKQVFVLCIYGCWELSKIYFNQHIIFSHMILSHSRMFISSVYDNIVTYSLIVSSDWLTAVYVLIVRFVILNSKGWKKLNEDNLLGFFWTQWHSNSGILLFGTEHSVLSPFPPFFNQGFSFNCSNWAAGKRLNPFWFFYFDFEMYSCYIQKREYISM